MIEKRFILATAGHVDHGKSSLVKALTGTDPDRLPEEKSRGITIDLGFAELSLTGTGGEKFHVGIVDVPGHEDFVRNMIAGVGSIDLALLVIAADDGWMPQTEEHLQILSYLGVKRAVIALTKSDLANSDNVAAEIREQLRDTAFANSRIIPTSILNGEGIENLKRALTDELTNASPPRDIGKPRLFVDRAFSLHGIGTVVTGTLSGGQLRRGQSVIVQPQNLPARIRSIQSHGRDLDVALPGMRTAISLPDIEIGDSAESIKRGDVLALVDLGAPSTTIDVILERSTRLQRNTPAARPLKSGASVYIHHGTSRLAAKIALLEDDALERGARTVAQLRLEAPIFGFIGDQFVVRDPSEQHTIAGGTVLDPSADRENFRDQSQIELLKARAAAPNDLDVCLPSELARRGLAKRGRLLIKSNFSADEIANALVQLESTGKIVLRGEVVAEADKWRDLQQRATASIVDAHRTNPERRGMNLNDLRKALPICDDEEFDALISDLCANDFVRDGSTISRVSHRATLPGELQTAAQTVRTILKAKPFDPPGRKDLPQDRHSQQALRFLIEQGEVVEISNEIVLFRDATDKMRDLALNLISTHGPATASQLRQEIGTSRRIIIPFLEYLDRCGITQRVGDSRQLRKAKSATVAHP